MVVCCVAEAQAPHRVDISSFFQRPPWYTPTPVPLKVDVSWMLNLPVIAPPVPSQTLLTRTPTLQLPLDGRALRLELVPELGGGVLTFRVLF